MPLTIHTARDLLTHVRRSGPLVEGNELTFVGDPPPELDALLDLLHTGVRALLTGRCWWGSTTAKPRVIELNPAAPIPHGIELLAVEGDARWDRIPPDARIDFPYLFAPAPSKR